jgi:xanthine dehydrogenase accessory factor
MANCIHTVDLFHRIVELIEGRRPFAVVTVLKTINSTPVKAGAKAILDETGVLYGTVGGGAVEAEAQRLALSALHEGISMVFHCDLRGMNAEEADPICGGSMLLLIDTAASHRQAEYLKAASMLRKRERGVWVTMLDSQSPLNVQTHAVPESAISDETDEVVSSQCRECLKQEKVMLLPASPESNETNRREWFLDPLIPKPILMLVGGGHVSQAAAIQGSLVGFEIVVVEDRPQYANPSLFPAGTKTLCGDLAEVIANFPIQRDTYIVIATRGHLQDTVALRACIHSSAAYVGMIGSRRKIPMIRQQFIDSGWASAVEFDRVHAPIGLDIGATDVPEIAASIVAELIAVRRKGNRNRLGTAS